MNLEQDEIVIVSGLPRSGTSMVMAMVAAGGVPGFVDDGRPADASNPKGYWEYGPVKRLKQDNSWLPKARGHVLKVVSPLLPYLPANERYQVIMVTRLREEVLASQRAMLLRLGETFEDGPELSQAYDSLDDFLRTWLPQQKQMQVMTIDHGAILGNPAIAAAQLNRFLGGGLNEAAMAGVVDPALYREVGSTRA